jgi:hypothetical protein
VVVLKVEIVDINADGILVAYNGHRHRARGLGVAALQDLPRGTIVLADVDVRHAGQVDQVFEVVGNRVKLEEAIELSTEGDWARLLQRFRSVRSPRDPVLCAFLLRALLELERADEAEKELAHILELRAPDRPHPATPKLSELYAAFSPESAERLIPARRR